MQEILLIIFFVQTFLNFILIFRTYDTYNDAILRLIDANEKIVLNFIEHMNNYYDEDEDSDDEDSDDEEDSDYEEESDTEKGQENNEEDGEDEYETDEETDDEPECDNKEKVTEN